MFAENGTIHMGEQFTLHISYDAPLHDDMDSFYWDTFTENGVNKYLNITLIRPSSMI